MEDEMMKDETAAVLKTFEDYTETFRQKSAIALLPFFDFPTLMVDRQEKSAVLSNPVVATVLLYLGIRKLKKQGYAYSKIHEMEAKQVRSNLAIVSGIASRHRENQEMFDEFGFTYTLRKKEKGWGIINGVIHEKSGFIYSKGRAA